jgi:hypothetical protein
MRKTSATYPDLTETVFPDAVDDLIRMSDLTAGDVPLTAEYYRLFESGDVNGANAFLQSHPGLIVKLFNAAKFNRLSDAITATQRVFRQDVDAFFADVQNKADELRFVGEYNPATQYRKNNIISYLKCLYLARKDSKNQTPIFGETTEYWALAARGIPGVSGTGLTPRGVWVNSTQYYADDLVSYNNILWQATADSVNSTPSGSNGDWLEILKTIPDMGFTWGNLAGLT